MKYYSNDHEWISIDNKIGTIGISDYAQNQLGDVVYVTLTKDIGSSVNAGDDVAEIESVKSVSQVFTPVGGKIVEFNEIFKDEANSGLINKDPYGQGWIFKLEIADPDQIKSLMDEEQYKKYLETL
jgi:glycine cleavage system H protein